MNSPNTDPVRKANRLIHATSPYLLQHAYNPVNWYEWGEEALTRAQDEHKPILVSIGYSSCHWCHVMEKESFEQEDIAQVMNDHFICIKVDREERPDIDHLYMDALQSMGMSGGWPLNVFLTPDQKPFYGGTYFQPHAWKNLLLQIHKAYQEKKYDIHQSANELTRHLAANELGRFQTLQRAQHFREGLEIIYRHLAGKFDHTWGGLDKAPKFIMPSIWLLLLRYYYLTGNEASLKHVNFTLEKILQGGIYDQLGGGFARYSVDAEWVVPHFEKMLYDNAQLLTLYAEAYSITRNPQFQLAIEETAAWLQRDMTSPEGGFYSALDADSEGMEGKFYCWKRSEIEALLKEDANLFCAYYSVTEQGNWEHQMNILNRPVSDHEFLAEHALTSTDWQQRLDKCKNMLLKERSKRIPPGLDDKILTGWNALTITGLLDAYRVLQHDEYLQLAYRAMQFLEHNLMEGNKIYRSFKGKRSNTEGFLEDYAYVISAYIKLYQSDFNEHWIYRAEQMMSHTISQFYDAEDGLFFFTSNAAEKLIARKKELFDNVIPSSNSTMAINLHHLGILTGRREWKALAGKMLEQVSGLVQHEPNYMSNWGIAWMELENSLAELGIVGPNALYIRKELGKNFLPFTLVSGTLASSELPVLKGKTTLQGDTAIYVCRNYTCQKPVVTVEDALAQIKPAVDR